MDNPMETVNSVQTSSVTVDSPEVQRSINQAAAIMQAAGAEAVYLFGSIAEGSFRPDSDVDLAVSGLPPDKFFHTMGQLLQLMPRPLDLVDLDVDTPFTRYLKQKGKLYRVV
jgi:predicted nucleotidyltransferase